MDRGMVIFVGSLLTLASSWLGLVVFPFWQLRDEPAYQKDAADDPYPQPLAGQGAAGRKVYQANGCMYCHSQQVRSEKFGQPVWNAAHALNVVDPSAPAVRPALPKLFRLFADHLIQHGARFVPVGIGRDNPRWCAVQRSWRIGKSTSARRCLRIVVNTAPAIALTSFPCA